MEQRETSRGAFRPSLTAAIIALQVLGLYGLFHYLRFWLVMGAFLCGLLLYTVSLLGITAGYHRYFTHGAFKCKEWVKYLLAFAGGVAGEGPLNQWVPDHHQHHAKTDKPWDPHSPHEFDPADRPPKWWQRVLGAFWAHMGWLFFYTKRWRGYNPSTRPEDKTVTTLQQYLYWPIVVVPGFLVPYWLLGQPGLWLAGFFRIFISLNVTWCVNSVCHMYGDHPMELDGVTVYTDNDARNNWFIAFLGFGEGWHGNHHVKPNAANLGRTHWYDPGYWVIAWLERLGLAWDVERFPVIQKS